MARNVIERIFGILKRRFSLMVASPEYSEDKQAKFIPALCVLHNFISIHDHDSTDTGQQLSPRADSSHLPVAPIELPQPVWVSEEEELSASARRDKIAAKMWTSYQQYLAERGIR
jgi:hypothetical protein